MYYEYERADSSEGNGTGQASMNQIPVAGKGGTIGTNFMNGANNSQAPSVAMQPYPAYPAMTIPQETIDFIKRQDAKIVALEITNKQLIDGIEQAQKDKLYAISAYERAKTKIPNAARHQFLMHRTGEDPGLMLVTREAGKVEEAIIQVGMSIVTRAAWVETEDKNGYLAIEFRNLDRLKQISTVYIPNEVYENNCRLINELLKLGISLKCTLSGPHAAALWRDYFSVVAGGQIFKEMPLGWHEGELGWQYTTGRDLPWWDSRNRFQKIKEVDSQRIWQAMERLKISLDTQKGSEEKILRLLPFAAELKPVLKAYGYVKEICFNLVMENGNLAETFKVSKIMGQTEVIRLPLGKKELKMKIGQHKGNVFLACVDAMEISMQEKNLLLLDIQSLLDGLPQNVLLMVCSTEPLWIPEIQICVVEIPEEISLGNCSFCEVEEIYKNYIEKAAIFIVNQIHPGWIPSVLGAYGSQYELFRVATIAVQKFLENFFGEANLQLDTGWLQEFFQKQAADEDRDGLGMQMIFYLQKAAESGEIKIISPFDLLVENAVIVTEEEIYFRKATLHHILAGELSAYNERTILRGLYEEGYLAADVGVKTNFTKRRRCTDANGEAQFLKFIVLRKEAVVRCGDYNFLT